MPGNTVKSFTANMALSIAERAGMPDFTAVDTSASGLSPPPMPTGIVRPRKSASFNSGVSLNRYVPPITGLITAKPLLGAAGAPAAVATEGGELLTMPRRTIGANESVSLYEPSSMLATVEPAL
jgi:hypothetical protein